MHGPQAHDLPVVVLDNGGATCKLGWQGQRSPSWVFPNCTARLKGDRQLYVGHMLLDCQDVSFINVRRPVDRGYVVNWDLQRDIWSHAFTLLQRDVTDCGLLLLDPPFNLQAIQQTAAEVIFEEFRFQHYLAAPAAPLSIRQHHLENPSCRASSAGCGLVVDAGFSFTHAVPVLDHQIVAQGVRRVGIGGKVLTNYLKELISYRSINMMEETYLVEQIKEAACLVSQDLKRDLNLARQPGGQSPFRCEYVLPDGLESMRGHLRPWQARPAAPKGSCKEQAVSLNNERFMVPELVFNPSDISLPQAGLAQTVFEAVDALHPDLHAPLFSNIVLTGGTARCPGFAPRLQQELRALVDSDLQVNVTLAKDPTVAAWQGGSLYASSAEYRNVAVTRADYEEHGLHRVSQ